MGYVGWQRYKDTGLDSKTFSSKFFQKSNVGSNSYSITYQVHKFGQVP